MTDYECSECGPLDGVLMAMKHQTENPNHHAKQKPEPSRPSVEAYNDDDESNRFDGPQEQDEYFDEGCVSDNDGNKSSQEYGASSPRSMSGTTVVQSRIRRQLF